MIKYTMDIPDSAVPLDSASEDGGDDSETGFLIDSDWLLRLFQSWDRHLGLEEDPSLFGWVFSHVNILLHEL